MDHYDKRHMMALLCILISFIAVMGLIFFNSKGNYTTEQHKADGECVEFLMKSNGWEYQLVEIREC